MAREDPQMKLRLPEEMRDQIKRAADENGRSMNAEIVEVLREYFPADPSLNEIIDALEYSVSMIEVVRDGLARNGEAPAGSIGRALAHLRATNDDLYKLTEKERFSPVAMLTDDAIDHVRQVSDLHDLGPELHESLISDLLIMGAQQVLSREARLRVHIGEGEHRRVVEIRFPEEELDRRPDRMPSP